MSSVLDKNWRMDSAPAQIPYKNPSISGFVVVYIGQLCTISEFISEQFIRTLKPKPRGA
jgi:hypothetical protein